MTRKSGHIWRIWAEMTQTLMPKSTTVAQIHLPECNTAKFSPNSAKIPPKFAKFAKISFHKRALTLNTQGTRYGNSVSTPCASKTNGTTRSASTDSPRHRMKEKNQSGNSVSTPHRRYGHRLRTPFLRTPFPRLLVQARKRHININFWVRLPRLSLGQSGFVPGTKPGFSLFYTKMDAQFVPGTNPVCPWTIPGTKGSKGSLCVKSSCAFFAPYLPFLSLIFLFCQGKA